MKWVLFPTETIFPSGWGLGIVARGNNAASPGTMIVVEIVSNENYCLSGWGGVLLPPETLDQCEIWSVILQKCGVVAFVDAAEEQPRIHRPVFGCIRF